MRCGPHPPEVGYQRRLRPNRRTTRINAHSGRPTMTAITPNSTKKSNMKMNCKPAPPIRPAILHRGWPTPWQRCRWTSGRRGALAGTGEHERFSPGCDPDLGESECLTPDRPTPGESSAIPPLRLTTSGLNGLPVPWLRRRSGPPLRRTGGRSGLGSVARPGRVSTDPNGQSRRAPFQSA